MPRCSEAQADATIRRPPSSTTNALTSHERLPDAAASRRRYVPSVRDVAAREMVVLAPSSKSYCSTTRFAMVSYQRALTTGRRTVSVTTSSTLRPLTAAPWGLKVSQSWSSSASHASTRARSTACTAPASTRDFPVCVASMSIQSAPLKTQISWDAST